MSPQSPAFFHYSERAHGSLDPSLAVAIGSQPFEETGAVHVAMLPEMTAVVSVARGSGSHDLIGPLYGQMARFAEDNGFEANGPGRDHIVGREGDEYVVEVQLPVIASA